MSAMPTNPQPPPPPAKKPRGLVHYKAGPFGERIPYVLCVDGRHHRYLTADLLDIQLHPPTAIADKPASCTACGHSMSELKGPKAVLCEECKWDRVAEWIMDVEAESGTRLMRPPPDHVEIRKTSKMFQSADGRNSRISNFYRSPRPPLRLKCVSQKT